MIDYRRSLHLFAAALAVGCASPNVAATPDGHSELAKWPARTASNIVDSETEGRIAAIVSEMTLEQKIGQMTQAEIRYITPDEVRQYYIGSVLNGGGSWPGMNKSATVEDWARLVDEFYRASMSTGMKTPVPVIWGTDAVHGHNNLGQATMFPHNIGLGAAHDTDLIYRIGRATAKAVRATGITWAFAPTLAVVQDPRWGRTYEGYSSDPEIVAAYADAMVRGLQGDLSGDGDVVATAKHFIGDGGTYLGKDQGENRAPADEMIRSHAAGYYAALDAGALTVMASYSSWNDVAAGRNYGKLHGAEDLLTGVLKERMAFDGLLVSDWNAIEQVPGCARDRCAAAINAGIDLVMVPEDWKAFIANTAEDVRSGKIPMSRIDDAVTRILRVKMKSGLFAKSPAAGAFTGQPAAVEARELAREAVRKSIVLLKNEGAALPAPRAGKLLVVGKSADSLPDQTGGWSITWQGDETENADFKTGETLLTALRNAVGADKVDYSPDGSGVDVASYSAVIAVIGENSYAEYKGDVAYPAPLAHSSRFPADLATLKAVSGRGVPVTTVFYSGRPVYANDLINLSDAFVAAFLPGSEAGGIADLILEPAPAGERRDFSATLSFDWPGDACGAAEGRADNIAFARGYGLRYTEATPLGRLAEPAAPASCE